MADPASATFATPVARSPIATTRPRIVDGWEVCGRTSSAALQLADRSALTKVLVRAAPGSAAASALDVGFGRCARRADGVLVIGSGPGEWLLVGGLNQARSLSDSLPSPDPSTSVVDVTHGRALVRLTGPRCTDLLAKICALDLREAIVPNGTASRSSVAKVVAEVVRDDLDGVPSFLLGCERSSGQYFFDAVKDAGAEFDLDVGGFDLR